MYRGSLVGVRPAGGRPEQLSNTETTHRGEQAQHRLRTVAELGPLGAQHRRKVVITPPAAGRGRRTRRRPGSGPCTPPPAWRGARRTSENGRPRSVSSAMTRSAVSPVTVSGRGRSRRPWRRRSPARSSPRSVRRCAAATRSAEAAASSSRDAGVGDQPAPADHDQVVGACPPARPSGGWTTSTARPSRGQSTAAGPRIHTMPSGSRPLTGSSNISTGGSPSSARGDAEPLPHAEREPAGPPPGRRRPARPCSQHLVHPARGQAVATAPATAGGRGPSGRDARRAASSSAPTSRQRRTAGLGSGRPPTSALPVVRRVQPEDHPHRGGLAGAVRADEPGHLAGLDRERQTVDRDRRAVPLAQLRVPRWWLSMLATLGPAAAGGRHAAERSSAAPSRGGRPRNRRGDGQCDRSQAAGAGATGSASEPAGSPAAATFRTSPRPSSACSRSWRPRTGATRPAWTSAPRSCSRCSRPCRWPSCRLTRCRWRWPSRWP